jgi:hypothetical protein
MSNQGIGFLIIDEANIVTKITPSVVIGDEYFTAVPSVVHKTIPFSS